MPIRRGPVFANPEEFASLEGCQIDGGGPVLYQSGGVPEIRSDPEESKKFYFYEGNRTDPNT